jgi:hypothetical protein
MWGIDYERNRMHRPDKRKMDRYDLNVPALISPRRETETDTRAWIEFKTKNVSSGGAFLITDRPYQIDTKVDIDIHIALFDTVSNRAKESDVHVSGTVVRVDAAGMAIKFDNKFQIVPAS